MIRTNSHSAFAPITPQRDINAETIRRDNAAWRSTALIITTAVLALAIGALLAMAQITIAALPDIIAQSAARNAW